jgi:hypothetical protein
MEICQKRASLVVFEEEFKVVLARCQVTTQGDVQVLFRHKGGGRLIKFQVTPQTMIQVCWKKIDDTGVGVTNKPTITRRRRRRRPPVCLLREVLV